jgi:hypothetical protein
MKEKLESFMVLTTSQVRVISIKKRKSDQVYTLHKKDLPRTLDQILKQLLNQRM